MFFINSAVGKFRAFVFLFISAVLLFLVIAAPVFSEEGVCINDLKIYTKRDCTLINVYISKSVAFKKTETLDPLSFIIEIPGATSKVSSAPIQVGRDPIKKVIVSASDSANPARIEILLSAKAFWRVDTDEDGKCINIQVSSEEIKPSVEIKNNKPSGGRDSIPGKSVQSDDNADSSVTSPSQTIDTIKIEQKKPDSRSAIGFVPVKNNPQGSNLLDCSFKDMDIQDVIQVIAKLAGVNIVVDANVKGKVTLNLKNVEWDKALRAALRTVGYSLYQEDEVYFVGKDTPESPPVVTMDSGLLSVSAKNCDIKKLLDAISSQSGINIITSPNVNGKVSVQLSNVPVEDGLYTFLTTNGYSFQKMNDIFVVDKTEAGKSKPPLRPYKQSTTGKITVDYRENDLTDVIADLSGQSGMNIVTYETMSDKITIRLVDVDLDEALKFVLAGTKYTYRKIGDIYVVGNATNLASPVAQMLTVTEIIPLTYIKAEECPKYLSGVIPLTNIKPLAEQNSLLVVGTEETVNRVKREIELVDRVVPQVMIEAQVVEVSTNAAESIGLQLQAAKGQFSANLPSDGQVVYTSSGNATESLSATLQLMVTQGKARVLANPKITTINGKEASINIIDQRYFRTGSYSDNSSSSGSAYYPYYNSQVQSVEAGIMLSIIPFVGASDEITVSIEPEVSNVTGTGPDGLPEISRRKATTTVRVRDGETIVIGGLKRIEESKSVTRTPLLSDIPIIGGLFTSKTTNERETELMIFITPSLISTEGNKVREEKSSNAENAGTREQVELDEPSEGETGE